MDTIDVTAAVIIREGKVLLARRPQGGRHPGMWEFPGGKVEPGETAGECLAREMAEEMGVVVEVGKKLAEVQHSYADIAIDLLAFECCITKGELLNLGCEDHQWVYPAELFKYEMLPPDRELAAMLFELSGAD